MPQLQLHQTTHNEHNPCSLAPESWAEALAVSVPASIPDLQPAQGIVSPLSVMACFDVWTLILTCLSYDVSAAGVQSL